MKKVEDLLAKLEVIDEKEQIPILMEISNIFQNKETTKAINFAERAKAIAIKYSLKKEEAEAIRYCAVAYFTAGDYKKSRELSLESLKLFREINFQEGICLSLFINGKCSSRIGDYNNSFNSLSESLNIARDNEDKKSIAIILNEFAFLYLALKDYDSAKKSLLECKKIYLEENETKKLFSVYSNLGNIFFAQKDYPKSTKYTKQAYEVAKKNGDSNQILISINNLGALFSSEKKYDLALENFNECLSLINLNNIDNWFYGNLLYSMATTYLELNDFQNSEKYLTQALEIGKTSDSIKLQLLGLRVKEKLEYKQEYFKQACDTGREIRKLEQQRSDNRNEALRSSLQLQFDLKEKEKEAKIWKEAHDRLEILIEERTKELQKYQEHLEELVKARTKDFQEILDETKIQLWAFDGKTYSYLNKEWYRYTGQDPTQPRLQENWSSLLHPDDSERALSNWETNLKNKTAHANQFRLRRYDGEYRYFISYSTPIYFDDGSFKRFQGYNVDVTEQKDAENKLKKAQKEATEMLKNLQIGMKIREQTEKALRISEANFSNFFLNLPVAAYRSTIESPGKFLMANSYMIDMFGYDSFEELQKTPILAIYSNQENRNSFIKSIKKDGFVRKIEFILVRKNGDEFCALCSARIVKDKNDNLLWIDGIIEDISEQKKTEKAKILLEKQIRHSQKLETIGTLTGGIAHDFNNILMPIMGYSELVKMLSKPQDPIYENVNEIYKASLRAKDLIQQLMSYSRQKEQERKPICLQPIIKEVIKLMRHTIPTTINISTDIAINCGKVLADSTKIHQILVNLCTNAYHAMEEKGGDLSIKLDQVLIDRITVKKYPKLKPGYYNKIFVSDTGIGMSIETQKQIFNPFFTTKEAGKGTGLGLAVVNGIIESHDGDISVTSQLGKGTTFEILLPILDVKIEENLEKETGSIIFGNNESILVVDDETSITLMIDRALKTMGYKATITNNSLSALEVFKENPTHFDLIISDYTMPNLTGTELAREVRKINKKIPFLIVSGKDKVVDESILKEIGIGEIIRKPINLIKFSKLIHDTLNSHKKK